MVVDVIIPVYRPEREKLTKLIDWLNKQTVKPSHVFFMQTLVEEKEDEEVLQMLQKAENVEIVPIEKKDFDHGGTRNKGAALSRADYMLFMTQDAVPWQQLQPERRLGHEPCADDHRSALHELYL